MNRYSFLLEVPIKNEDGGVIEPQLHVDVRTKTQVYQGEVITAITLDED